MKIKKILWLILGFIVLGLGALGAVLPILPTVPFLLLAAVSFAKSSDKLNNWFINTKLYKNNLESYVKGQGMSFKSKVKVIITVTLLMAIGLTLYAYKRNIYSMYYFSYSVGYPYRLLHVLCKDI